MDIWIYLAGSAVGFWGFLGYLVYRFPDNSISNEDRLHAMVNALFSWFGVIGLVGAIVLYEWKHRDD